MKNLNNIDKVVWNMNRQVQSENKFSRLRSSAGQVIGALVILASSVDMYPDVIRESFSLVRNSPDLLGILAGAIFFIYSRRLGNQVNRHDEERRTQDLDIVLKKRFGAGSAVDKQPIDIDKVRLN